MLSGGTLTVVGAAHDYACAGFLRALREGFVAYCEAILGDSRDIGAQRQNLCAGRHDVVGGDVVADLECNAGLDGFSQRLVYRERLDVRTAEDLNGRSLLNGSRRNHHVIVDDELLGHHIGRHVAAGARVGEYAGECGNRSSLRGYQVDLRVLGAASAEEVTVECTQGDTLAVRGLTHAYAGTAGALKDSRAGSDKDSQCAVLSDLVEYLLGAGGYRKAYVRVYGLAL